jgi:hypothetical protein
VVVAMQSTAAEAVVSAVVMQLMAAMEFVLLLVAMQSTAAEAVVSVLLMV